MKFVFGLNPNALDLTEKAAKAAIVPPKGDFNDR